ncbi:GNAT family N-acetyltransferase [Roseibium sp. RKSG952]|uniref:GNAT family N-acetyltransferase n=1 Tax=Roseibium sp. RKSG952 TaxID=2529384 RepID=UPI0012BBD78E|nr:GNAT family N-acetyltransferase [Roseibium sp. RKSG952]MTH99557.1 GNAT family N-acetyltransferase [Roseibium sp. RKSG952]
MPVEIRTLTPAEQVQRIEELATLRMRVFREWPYLDAGSLAFEHNYLRRQAQLSEGLTVGGFDGNCLIGTVAGKPLKNALSAYREPLESRGHDTGSIFYLAEIVLDHRYRGRGLGHEMFVAYEQHAKRLGYETSMLCCVIRSENHSPGPGSVPYLDRFWEKHGYDKLRGVVAHCPWQDVGEAEETEKPMQVWWRRL